MVWFTASKQNGYQKALEIGFSDQELQKMIPPDVYRAIKDETLKMAKTSKYDSRGTNEVLLIKKSDGSWEFVHSEFNCRIQVEHKALADLSVDSKDHPRNVAAEQVLRACGFAPPQSEDEKPSVYGVIVHLRLTNSHPDKESWEYKGGRYIGYGGKLPQGVELLTIAPEEIAADKDPQIGRLVIKAKDWKDAVEKLKGVAENLVLLGHEGQISQDYLAFIRQLVVNSEFEKMDISTSFGCNQTSSVLSFPYQPMSQEAARLALLSGSLLPILVNGFESSGEKTGTGYPTTEQLTEVSALRNNANIDRQNVEKMREK